VGQVPEEKGSGGKQGPIACSGTLPAGARRRRIAAKKSSTERPENELNESRPRCLLHCRCIDAPTMLGGPLPRAFNPVRGRTIPVHEPSNPTEGALLAAQPAVQGGLARPRKNV
jgi:hypothetical protein